MTGSAIWRLTSKLEPETTWMMKCWYFGEWALYGIKPVLIKPSVHRYWWPSVNSANSINWADIQTQHTDLAGKCNGNATWRMLLKWGLSAKAEVMRSVQLICYSVILSACVQSRAKILHGFTCFFTKGRSWPSLKVISFWRWSSFRGHSRPAAIRHNSECSAETVRDAAKLTTKLLY